MKDSAAKVSKAISSPQATAEPSSPSIPVHQLEVAKGGVSYEVVLTKIESAGLLKFPLQPHKPASPESVEEKLKAAEARRVQMLAEKMAKSSAEKIKVEKVTKNKKMTDRELTQQMSKALEAKLKQTELKREFWEFLKQKKCKTVIKKVERVRRSLEAKRSTTKSLIEEKMKTVEENRRKTLGTVVERRKEHWRYIEWVLQRGAKLKKLRKEAAEAKARQRQEEAQGSPKEVATKYKLEPVSSISSLDL